MYNVYGHLFSISWRCSLNQVSHTLSRRLNLICPCLCIGLGANRRLLDSLVWCLNTIEIGICFASELIGVLVHLALSTFLSLIPLTLYHKSDYSNRFAVIVCECLCSLLIHRAHRTHVRIHESKEKKKTYLFCDRKVGLTCFLSYNSI